MTDDNQIGGGLENVDDTDPVEEDYQYRIFLERQGEVIPGDHTVISFGKKVDDGGNADPER